MIFQDPDDRNRVVRIAKQRKCLKSTQPCRELHHKVVMIIVHQIFQTHSRTALLGPLNVGLSHMTCSRQLNILIAKVEVS